MTHLHSGTALRPAFPLLYFSAFSLAAHPAQLAFLVGPALALLARLLLALGPARRGHQLRGPKERLQPA